MKHVPPKLTWVNFKPLFCRFLPNLEKRRRSTPFQLEEFQAMFKEVNAAVESFDLGEIIARRIRRLPFRLIGPASAHQTVNVEEYFRKGYYEVIDSVLM